MDPVIIECGRGSASLGAEVARAINQVMTAGFEVPRVDLEATG
jgi:hypothetical protein